MVFRWVFLLFFIPACNHDLADLSDSMLELKDSVSLNTSSNSYPDELQNCFSNVHYAVVGGKDYAVFFNAASNEIICIPDNPAADHQVKTFHIRSGFKGNDFFICNDSLYLFSTDHRNLNVYRFLKDSIPVNRNLESHVLAHLKLSMHDRIEIIQQLKQPYLAFSNGHLHTSLARFKNVYAHGCMDLNSSNQVYQFGENSSEIDNTQNSSETDRELNEDVVIGYAFSKDLELYSIENNRLNKFIIKDELDTQSENNNELKSNIRNGCTLNGAYNCRLIEFPFGNNIARLLKPVQDATTVNAESDYWNIQIINPENENENSCIKVPNSNFTPGIAWFWKSGIVLSGMSDKKSKRITFYYYQFNP